MDKTAFEPRIGSRGNLGSRTTVVRGGYAIFHDSSWNRGAQGLWQNPPYTYESGSFAFGGGCTFATSACATKYRQSLPRGHHASKAFPSSLRRHPLDFSGTSMRP